MKPQTIELCKTYLFDELPDTMADQFKNKILRLRAAYAYWLEAPDLPETEIRQRIESMGCSVRQSYEDLKILKALVGDLKKVSKDWHRARLIEMTEETYKIAKGKKDARGMAAAIANYGKFTQLDKEDPIDIPFDQLVFAPWEPTENPEASGFKKIANVDERIKKLEERYSEDLNNTTIDVSYEEINEKDEEDFSE